MSQISDGNVPKLTSNEKIKVGAWFSTKKYLEMGKKGLLSAEAVLKYRDLLTPVYPDAADVAEADYPITFERLDLGNPEQMDKKYDVILHKNSELMAHAFFFQIPQDLEDYTALRKLIESHGDELVLLDPLDKVEAIALDRCTQYNELLRFLPIGENQDLQHNINTKQNTTLKDAPLWVCLPTSLLLNVSKEEEQNDNDDNNNNHTFVMTPEKQKALVTAPDFAPKMLTLDDALRPHQIPQYPLLFDQYGDGIQQNTKDGGSSNSNNNNNNNNNNTLEPALLCLKSPLSCGTGLSHSMVLTHNAHKVIVDGNQQEFTSAPLFTTSSSTSSTTTPSTELPPRLPEGLHVITQVPPHQNVYKVYVIGDYIDIEVRDSIAINEMYYTNAKLQQKSQIYEQIVKEAEDLFYNTEYTSTKDNNKKKEIYDIFKKKCNDLILSYNNNNNTDDNDNDNEQDKNNTTTPNTLYFNSRYMQMHRYNNNSFYNNNQKNINKREQEQKEQQYDDGLLHYDDLKDLKSYLYNIMIGKKQPLLSLLPNTFEMFQKIQNEFQQVQQSQEKQKQQDNNNIEEEEQQQQTLLPLKQIIQYTSTTSYKPLYLPTCDIYQHALYESTKMDNSIEYKDHLQIGKLIKQLSSSMMINEQQQEEDKNNTTTTTTLELGITNDFKKSVKEIITILQTKLNMTFFGIDIVQNKYTGALYLIDINYFPSYALIDDFATRVHNEIIQSYINNKKNNKQ